MSGPAGEEASARPPGGPLVLVTRVGAASGSKPAAAALACAASEPDRAALLIDLDDGRAPRSTLVATAGARALEERLAAHMPDAAVASRGQICHLKLSPDPEGVERLAAALPLVRESAAVLHAPPPLLRSALAHRPTAALLRADLDEDRALTALAVRDLIGHGLRLAVLKRPLGRLTTRAALLGALPEASRSLPAGLRARLLDRAQRQGSARPREADRDRRRRPGPRRNPAP
jgi:hypothetical protein